MQDDNEKQIAKQEAKHFGLDFVELRGKEIPKDVLNLIDEDVARKNQLVVFDKKNKLIYLALANAERLKNKAPEILTKLKNDGYSFKIFITTESDLHYALLGYKQKQENEDRLKSMKLKQELAPGNGKKSDISSNDGELEFIDLTKLTGIESTILNKIPKKIALKYRIIIFEISSDGKQVKMAIEDPDNLQTQEIINFIASRNKINVKQYKTNEKSIEWALKQYDQKSTQSVEPGIISKKQDSEEGERKEIKEPNKTFDDIKNKYQTTAENKIRDKEANNINDDTISNVNVADISGEIKKIPEQEEYTTKIAISDSEQNIDSILSGPIANLEDLIEIIKTGSIPKIVAAILSFAVKKEASDIHIESDGKNLKLRYRVDGILQDIVKMPMTLQAPVISRIKILSKLKIDEQRIPQDGRFDILIHGKSIDLRVSTMPTIHGETCVMRLLDKSTGIIAFEKLGLTGLNLNRTNDAIKKPYGIIFVTGPTGSGKTTTLYAMLNILNSPEVNIVTLEDPVEYELAGINQSQIKPKIGFDFANGLRSILRQDPNIIMVGEVRDSETANMATHAALTGHLVLSTLHTNDSTGALPRLMDMGVEPYLITSSINLIIAQRLVRKLCPKCKESIQIPEKLLAEIKDTLRNSNDPEIKKRANDELKFYKAKGCDECKDGYKGRIGLFEVLEINDRIEQLAVNRASSSVIRRAALNQGLVTIREDGYLKALQGETTIDEVIRVTK